MCSDEMLWRCENIVSLSNIDFAPKSKTISFSFTCLDVSGAFTITNAGNRKQLVRFLIMSYHRIYSLNRDGNIVRIRSWFKCKSTKLAWTVWAKHFLVALMYKKTESLVCASDLKCIIIIITLARQGSFLYDGDFLFPALHRFVTLSFR